MLFDIYDEIAANFIIDKLNMVDIDFFRYDNSDNITADFMNDKLDIFKDIIGASWIKCGASKAVIYFEKEFPNIVFKIPFFGSISGNYNCETKEFELDYDTIEWFHYANSNISDECDWDYCNIERKIFEEAVFEDVDSFFAETKFLCDYDYETPIYISEFVDSVVCDEINLKPSHKSLNSAAKLMKERDNFNAFSQNINATFLDCYNEENVIKLMEFIEKWNIDDIHCSNIGFDKNNKIRIIDYSGFYE